MKVPLRASVYNVRPSHNRITEHMAAEIPALLLKTRLRLRTDLPLTAASHPTAPAVGSPQGDNSPEETRKRIREPELSLAVP